MLKYFTHKKEFVHSTKTCTDKIVHSADLRNLQISAFGKIFALQICAFCARRFFAHLQICAFVFLHICRKFANMREMFLHLCAFVKTFCKSVRM